MDWELADWGDPCWDVAAIFSAFIVFWIQSLPLAQGEGIQQAMKISQFPIEKMQPAMRDSGVRTWPKCSLTAQPRVRCCSVRCCTVGRVQFRRLMNMSNRHRNSAKPHFSFCRRA